MAGRALRSHVSKALFGARRVHTGPPELLTVDASSYEPVHLFGDSTVQVTSGLKRLKHLSVLWRDVVTAWREYRPISPLQNEELYGKVQNKVFSLTSTSEAADHEEAVLSYFMAHLRFHQILPLYQYEKEYMVTVGHGHPTFPAGSGSNLHPDFSVHAWGQAAEAFVPPGQHVTVYTSTWLRQGVESIHVPWWMMQQSMEEIAQYNAADFQQEYINSDEELSAITHHYEIGTTPHWYRRRGTKLMCIWQAVICRLDSWPLRIDISGMPYIVRFRTE